MALLHYVQQFTMPKQLGSNQSRRRKAVVVIVRPYLSLDPSSPKYEEYCRQKSHQPRHTSHTAPATPHQPLSTHLCIHRIRAHARPHNAVHSPSLFCDNNRTISRRKSYPINALLWCLKDLLLLLLLLSIKNFTSGQDRELNARNSLYSYFEQKNFTFEPTV